MPSSPIEGLPISIDETASSRLYPCYLDQNKLCVGLGRMHPSAVPTPATTPGSSLGVRVEERSQTAATDPDRRDRTLAQHYGLDLREIVVRFTA